MKAYKLTTQDNSTKNNTLWGEGITHKVDPSKTYPDLCTDSWLHFYRSPLIAVLLNPIHAKITNPILWECIARGPIIHEPLKSGCKELTAVKMIPLPIVSNVNRIAFGILCSLEVYSNPAYVTWAYNWLHNINREKVVANAAATAAVANVNYATVNAVNAVHAAVNAAAAAALDAVDATVADVDAAYAAAYTAYAAINTNFTRIAHAAMKIV